MKHTRQTFAFFLLAAVLIAAVSHGQDDAEDDDWRFVVTPSFWFPAADFDATVDGATAPIDITFCDNAKDFDAFGLSGTFEGWKGDWGFIFDSLWYGMDTDMDLPGPAGRTEIVLGLTQIGLALGYRAGEVSWMDVGEEEQPRLLKFDVYGGGRYGFLKTDFDIKGSGGLPSLSGDKDWVEPYAGGRVTWELTGRLDALLDVNVGGFGIGSATDRNINLLVGCDYHFSEKWSFKAGYRLLDIDYNRGSGADEFGMDGRIHGLQVGLSYYF